MTGSGSHGTKPKPHMPTKVSPRRACACCAGTAHAAAHSIPDHSVAFSASAIQNAVIVIKIGAVLDQDGDCSSSSFRIPAISSGCSLRSFLSSSVATSLPGEPSKNVRTSFFSAESRAFSGAMAGSYT